MTNPTPTPSRPASTEQEPKNDQALDDFCADSIRRMRGMKSFNGIGSNRAMARGKSRALSSFCSALHKAFPQLTEKEIYTLRGFANERVHEWTTIQTASAALTQGGRRE